MNRRHRGATLELAGRQRLEKLTPFTHEWALIQADKIARNRLYAGQIRGRVQRDPDGRWSYRLLPVAASEQAKPIPIHPRPIPNS